MPSLFSAISSQIQAKMSDATMKSPALKEGQVILGKIKQLHLNQLATVQLGSHQLTAKLQASLESGQSYLFEVETTGETPKLKVIEQSNATDVKSQVMQLFKELGIKPSKADIPFFEDIIRDQMPIKKDDVSKLHQLMKDHPSKDAKQVFKQMVNHRLPLSESVFQALNTSKQTSQSFQSQAMDLFQSLLSENSQSDTLTQLESKLNVLMKPTDQNQSLATKEESNGNNQTNATTKSNDFNHVRQNNTIPMTNQAVNEMTDEQVELTNRLNQQVPLSNKQLFQLTKALNSIEESDHSITPKQLEQLRTALASEDVQVKLAAKLPTTVSQQIKAFVDVPDASRLEQIFPELSKLVQAQFDPSNQREVFSQLNRLVSDSNTLFSVKDQFLIHMKDYLQTSGLDYEQQLAQNQEQIETQSPPLKQLLMQALNESGSQSREIEMLMNQFTNQQLHTIQENQNFIHVATQLPGMFGMDQEIGLEFYSRKDEDKRIDSNYCRIAFMLELGQIGETMIDMNVQNRMIQLTIYNEDDLSHFLDEYKPALEKGLEDLNYRLGSVYFKPMPDHKGELMIKPSYDQPVQDMSYLDVKI